ncbi:MAG: hypothetical protein IPH57_09555 [Saprospiraceae bacterium]|nr:hypothetical protein [Saprospiraceae bacterium]
MSLSGKHQYGELQGTRVTFVEKGISSARMSFLKNLLEVNGFSVLTDLEKKKNEDDPDLYTIGVTDLVFNPTIWVYDRKLRTSDGRKVTPDYWLQKTEDTKPQYWESMWEQ